MSYIRNKWDNIEIDRETEITEKINQYHLIYFNDGVKLPKVVVSGVAAHGYGGDHSGMGTADKLNYNNETFSSLATGLTARSYAGWTNDILGGTGIAIGGTSTNSGVTTNATKMTLSDGTTSELTVSSSLVDGQARGGIYSNDFGLFYSTQADNIIKHSYSDDSFSTTGHNDAKGYQDTSWTDYNNKLAYIAIYDDADKVYKIDLDNDTRKTVTLAHNMGDRDNVWTSFREKTIGTIGGITQSFSYLKNKLQNFHFSVDKFTIMNTWTRNSGEDTQLMGENAYITGGYGSGGQNAYSEVLSYDTGVVRTLPNTSSPRSSGCGYI